MTPIRLSRIVSILALSLAPLAHAADEPAYGPELEGFTYPAPVKQFDFTSQRVKLHMAYMDIAPTGKANGRTVVLLHGKNFCGATWEGSMKALAGAGYRVVVPDQIGFCKSSQPRRYQYSFQQLAENTRALLESIGVKGPVTMMGHSTGGMLAAPQALQPKLGNYRELAQKTARAIPKATLVSFPDMGHAPQMQDPAAFHAALLKGLKAGR